MSCFAAGWRSRRGGQDTAWIGRCARAALFSPEFV